MKHIAPNDFCIGIVSGKLGGVDGVSLEVDKWIKVLTKQGFRILTIAGKYVNTLNTVSADSCIELSELRFDSEFQRTYELQAFPHIGKHPQYVSAEEKAHITKQIEMRGHEVGVMLAEYVKEYGIDVLIGENTNAMPMTLLGGVAMYYAASVCRIATIFHHHDFWWERSRFSYNCIDTLLNRIMPPNDLGIEHIVISSYAAHILTSLKRVKPYIIHNCEDFQNPPVLDDYNKDFRADFGFQDDDILVVQPTRIVPRKRIEDSLLLLSKFLTRYPHLRRRLHYIISLYQGDEHDEYYIDHIKKQAEDIGLPMHLISDRVKSVRQTTKEGLKVYTNRDVLVNADIVTYLPIWEGFGNALLEAVAARVPVVTTTYLVYKTDIMITGIRTILIRDKYDAQGNLIISDDIVEEIYHILTHSDDKKRMVEHSFQVGLREFSLDRLHDDLQYVFLNYGDEIRASRKRIQKSQHQYSV